MTHVVLRATVLFASLLTATVCAAEYRIHAEVWARPRSAEALLALPALQALLRDFDHSEGATIEIRYPGGEAGVLWAQELQDWLVALGVPAARIHTAVGSGVEDSVRLLLNKRGVRR